MPPIASNDTVLGTENSDVFVSGSGSDSFDGGGGFDTYVVTSPSPTSYTFIGSDASDQAGYSVSSAGDIDGDGLDDLIIGAPLADGASSNTGESYLITAADLAAADAADGSVDGVIDLDNVDRYIGSGTVSGQTGTTTSYTFVSNDPNGATGWSVSAAGDVDNDGSGDLLIGGGWSDGSGTNDGVTYLITASDLAIADAADGTIDGVIDLGNVDRLDSSSNNTGTASSYTFYGEGSGDFSGWSVSSAGDVDGDGVDDLLIGAPYAYSTEPTAGATYLITSTDLASADLADGTADGLIDLANIDRLTDLGQSTGTTTSYAFVGIASNDIAGFSVSSAGDVDGDGKADIIIGAAAAEAGGIGSGSAYLITSADLAAADAADGSVDGVINLGNVDRLTAADTETGTTTSYTFLGEDGAAGVSVSSAGDVDNDGRDDLLIGADLSDAGGSLSGQAYLVTAADLAAADAADGSIDGTIFLANIDRSTSAGTETGTTTSYTFIGSGSNEYAGHSVSSAGDVDGDGFADILIGAYGGTAATGYSGTSYLITGVDLAAADAADGEADGIIDLANVDRLTETGTSTGTTTSYTFVGLSGADNAGWSVSSAGDVDGDGYDDLVIGASSADGGGANSGESYLVTAADLASADAADGTVDGVINLSNILGQTDTIVVNIDDTGSGTVSKFIGGTDTLTSIETIVAGESVFEADEITITDTGGGFRPGDIAGLDDNAVGTFTPASGDPAIAFGPGEAFQLSDVLAQISTVYLDGGTFRIVGGDESGSVGGISFENFETINFEVSAVCFAQGTLIKTLAGETPVEELKVGDQVLTMDCGYQPIRWIGGNKLSADDLKLRTELRPIRIRAGALGCGLPTTDLVVSPQHRILVRNPYPHKEFGTSEFLVAAKKLLALPGFEIVHSDIGVEYFHVLFDEHQIIFSNGAPTESLYTGPEALKAVSPEARNEILAIFPMISDPDFYCEPARFIPQKGRKVRSLFQRVQDRNVRDLVKQEWVRPEAVQRDLLPM